MRIIKLNAIGSTNTYLRQISTAEAIEDYTVVTAKYQTQGRGQMGTVWTSENDKNLIFSILKSNSKIHIDNQFYISMVTSLAIAKTLQSFSIPKLHIKWPNDILSDHKKICGILIENVIKNNKIEASIIGIGLNVNQIEFTALQKVSSLKILTGTTFNLDELLPHIVNNLKYFFAFLEKGNLAFLKTEYQKQLFQKDKPSSFKDQYGNIFTGFIKGINTAGHLQILLEEDVLKEFNLKEVKLLY